MQERLSILAMGAVLAASQLLAIGLSGSFDALGLRAFPEPENPTNALVYIVMILAFTAVILALLKFRRRDLAKYLILGSIFLTLAFLLLFPMLIALVLINESVFATEFGGNLASLLAFVVAGGLVYALVKYPEWYVIDTIGLAVAVGVTAIMGISFAVVPAILLLIGLAAYDAWAVYRTKHMVTLADELTSQRLPVLLVIPKRADYSFLKQKSLKDQVATGEEREAMFIGLGDLIIPGVLSVSAFNFLPGPGSLGVALATVVGSLVGFAVLMRFVLGGHPQAGLPLLNGGAIAGFLAGMLLVYGTIPAGLL